MRGATGVYGNSIADLRLCIPAVAAELRTIRSAVRSWATGHRLPAEVLVDLQLAVGEAAANGVEHAYDAEVPGSVEIGLSLLFDEQRVTAVAVLVADRGRWRPAPLTAGYRGRGLTMIGRLAERVRVTASRAGTRVSFEIPVPA